LYLELAKARLCALVLVTTAVGFVVASGAGVAWAQLCWTLLGTALAAFGANALNQCIEVARDARMERTRERPLPAQRLRPAEAWTFALVTAVVGPLVLLWAVNPLAAGLAVLTELIYVLVYTPLKVHTPMNTLVGAIVGALPPMIGWAGALGVVSPGAFALAAILFVWQIPHFLALAWLYRDDYLRGGFRMLPAVDADGRLTSTVALLYSVLLVPLGLSVMLLGLAGPWYGAAALVLGLGMVAAAVVLWRTRQRGDARRLFLASVTYLPLLLGVMVADRQTGWRAVDPTAAGLTLVVEDAPAAS
jgi:protoheme IX farnesyltransferase